MGAAVRDQRSLAASRVRGSIRKFLAVAPDLKTDEAAALHAALTMLERFRRPPAAHGEYRKYQSGCRCDACRTAMRHIAYAGLKARRARGLAPDDPRHGTVGAYTNWGCRCDACSIVHSDACKRNAARRKSEGEAVAA